MTSHRLKIRSIDAVAVSVPMNRPLGTSAQSIRNAPLLLVTLLTEDGIRGRSYAFCYVESVARSLQVIVRDLNDFLAGHDVAPIDLSASIARYFKLTGLYGPLLMVASAIDSAAWDVLSIAAGVPLAVQLGGSIRPVQAYNSNGLGLMPAGAAADEAEQLVSAGFSAVKMRLGRPRFADDLIALRAVRKRLSDDIAIMVDFNQALSFPAAMQYCPQLDDEGVYWIEEPIRHDDFEHLAMVAAATKTPLQLGENLVGLPPVFDSLKANATDYLMFDVDRIGGTSGWRSAAGIAAAAGRPVSSHLFPEISAHLLAATPTAHWLEYVDWANPLLEEPLRISDGKATPSDHPGNGLSWDADAVKQYRLP
ncbi:enolase C-terminal domain-like protein [Paraburkholderia rhizosphaerae]|uniref:Mandelate racemase n=1 Tax=Paraburkholderia rhizosphaerae TaxID=480658 RepID=A0A4R8LV56_9BURK|nr:enolase C-terminal domain-like protein [Paraburkholderia rhizosphaerae]TDY51448.1 mandelate racemase [Paraburkholderia rhizosphaerae]